MRMLAKQQHILKCTGFPRRHHTFLQFQGFGVADQSQIDDGASVHVMPSNKVERESKTANATPLHVDL